MKTGLKWVSQSGAVITLREEPNSGSDKMCRQIHGTLARNVSLQRLKVVLLQIIFESLENRCTNDHVNHNDDHTS